MLVPGSEQGLLRNAWAFLKNDEIENNHFKWDMLGSDIIILLKNSLVFLSEGFFEHSIFVGIQKALLYLKLNEVI